MIAGLRRLSGTVGVARVVLFVGMILAVAFELRAGRLSVFMFVMAVWVALPFLLLLRSIRATSATAAGILYLVGAGLLGWSSLMAYRPSTLASSSTAGLVFIFLPIWQLIGVGIIVLISDRLLLRSSKARDR